MAGSLVRLVCTGLLFITSLFTMLVLPEVVAPLVAETDLLMAPLSRPPVPDLPNAAAAARNEENVIQVVSL
jgi:hypothetical protein